MKKKLLLIIPNLECGGAQRFFVNFTNTLDKDKYDINLVIFNTRNSVFLETLRNDIKITIFDVSRVRYGLYRLYKYIKDIKPDIIFSTLAQINIPLGFFKRFFFPNIKFIAREANLVSHNIFRYKNKNIWNFLYKKSYGYFDKIVCISKIQSNDLVDNYKIDFNKIRVIYNPILIDNGNFNNNDKKIEKFFKDKNITNFVAVGSLSYQKGFERLIKSFIIIKKLNFNLFIVGEGPYKQRLLELIDKHNLKHKIFIIGYSNNPYIWIKKSDFFVVSSLYEGLCTSMVESICIGTPVLAYPMNGISKEILSEINGCHYIEKDSIDEFSKLLVTKINNKYRLDNKYSLKFDPKIINNHYENLFNEFRDYSL